MNELYCQKGIKMNHLNTLKLLIAGSLFFGAGEGWAARRGDPQDKQRGRPQQACAAAGEKPIPLPQCVSHDDLLNTIGFRQFNLGESQATPQEFLHGSSEHTPNYEKILTSLQGDSPPLEDLIRQLSHPSGALLSHREVFQLSQIFEKLSELVSKGAPPALMIPVTKNTAAIDLDAVPVIDVDFCLFRRANLITKLSIAMADKARNQKERLTACEQLTAAIPEVEQYILQNKFFTPLLIHHEKVRNFKLHEYIVYNHLTNLHLHRSTLSRHDAKLSVRLEYANEAVTIFKDALTLAPPIDSLHSTHQRQQFGLLQCCCHKAVLNLENGNEKGFDASLQEARNAFKDLKKTLKQGDEYFKLAEIHLSACEEQKQAYLRSKKGAGKIAEIRFLNFLEVPEKAQAQIRKLGINPEETFDEKKRILKKILSEKYLFKKGVKTPVQSLIPPIQDFETWVARDASCDPQDFQKIYTHYATQSRSSLSERSLDLIQHILIFVETGDLAGAAQRSGALCSLIPGKGPDHFIVHYVDALIQNLRGNFEPLLALNEALEAKRKEQENAQKAKKDKQRQKRAEKAVLNSKVQQEQLAITEASQAEKDARKAEKKKAQVLAAQQATARSVAEVFDPAPLNAEQTRERQARHEAAQVLREAGAEKTPSASSEEIISEKPSPSPQELREAREAILQRVLGGDPTPLSELFTLRGAPEQVEKEIIAGTWRFTRSQFHTYLGALGCTESRMRGSHETISLPKMICVTQGPDIIMVLSEGDVGSEAPEGAASAAAADPTYIPQVLGGSLTLPPWDGKHVPLYLREQILKARERLRGFALLGKGQKP